mmetsp:Transcript_36519/g.115186  ORF Transcript_36519/g.115186 Transcript_36519/m.115186 type:complete len:194 (+) Transcript_36519:63-644(+)
MREACDVLRNATQDSLVILDELGRGTSTHDGYAIAYAVLVALTSRTRCRTLFATHHHNLLEEPDLQPPMASAAHMASTSREGNFVPLFKLTPGPAPNGSCGVQVAGFAGLPDGILQAALARSAWFKRRRRARAEGRGEAPAAGSAPPLSGRELELVRRLYHDPMVADQPDAVGDDEWAAEFFDLWARSRGAAA